MNCDSVRYSILASLVLVVLGAPLFAQNDPPPIDDKQLKQATNNLKIIGLAFHNAHDTTGGLPGNIVGKDGKALLSWRVAILPYIEEAKLYKEFKLTEAWDSDHNKKLIEKMPKTYAPIRVKAKEGETYYQVFTGEKAIFGGKKVPKIFEFLDGTSNTGMIFEAGEPVIWTKPADLPFDEKKPLPKLGGLFDGSFHVCMGDGAVRRFKKVGDEAELKKLIMPNDGNPIDFEKIEK